jgi:hypothetical protein
MLNTRLNRELAILIERHPQEPCADCSLTSTVLSAVGSESLSYVGSGFCLHEAWHQRLPGAWILSRRIPILIPEGNGRAVLLDLSIAGDRRCLANRALRRLVLIDILSICSGVISAGIARFSSGMRALRVERK